MKELFRCMTLKWSAVIVDESQVLLRQQWGHFKSECGKFKRSNFSGLFKGLLQAQNDSDAWNNFPFAVFAGTGMLKAEMDAESNAGVAKYSHSSDKLNPSQFTNFKPLASDAVELYLSKFLCFSNVSSDVKEHIAKWLRGRPRWAATFVEEFLVRSGRSDLEEQTRGDFNEEERALVQALDRFLLDMTREKRRVSWMNGNRTAYTAFGTFNKRIGRAVSRKDLKEVERNVYKCAVGGHSSLLTEHAAELIETGVAALRVEESSEKSERVAALIDEPIVIEAGI